MDPERKEAMKSKIHKIQKDFDLYRDTHGKLYETYESIIKELESVLFDPNLELALKHFVMVKHSGSKIVNDLLRKIRILKQASRERPRRYAGVKEAKQQ